jgi:hypothetical protein
MDPEKQAAVEAEMRRVKGELDAMVMNELTGQCAALRLENAALRKALAEKDQPAP